MSRRDAELVVRARNEGEAAIRDLTTDLEKLSVAQGRVTDSSTKTAGALSQVEAQLSELEAKSAALKSLSSLVTQSDQAAAALSRMDAALEKSKTKLGELQAKAAAGQGGNRIQASIANQTEAIARQEAAVTKARASFAALQGPINSASSTLGVFGATQTRIAEAMARADSEAKKYRSAIAGLTPVLSQASGATDKFSSAQDRASNSSREALNITQRIRGQVLSLISAYGGLFAAQGVITGVVSTIKTLDAANSRMTAAFQGNAQAAAGEMKFLQQTADKLGLSIGTLSLTYSKFLVASQQAGISLGTTRSLFESVSVAARVNKLSAEDQTRVFRALEQIISKGKFTAEEVTQQLGDVLPGAVNILAKALKVPVDQLNQMQKNGEALATEGNLKAFGEEMNNAFGAGLSNALKSTTTELNKLENSGFKAYSLLASGGAEEAIAALARSINELVASKEGTEFLVRMGEVMGGLIGNVTGLVQLFQTALPAINAFLAPFIRGNTAISTLTGGINPLGIALGALTLRFLGVGGPMKAVFAGFLAMLRVVPALATGNTTLAASLLGVQAPMAGTAAQTLVVSNSMSVARAQMAATAVGARGLGAAFFAALGPIGLVIGAIALITASAGAFSGTAADSNVILEQHTRIVNLVGAAYTESAGDIDKMKEALDKLSLSETETNFRNLGELLNDAGNEITYFSRSLAGFAQGKYTLLTGPVRDLVKEYANGVITVDELKKKVAEFNAQSTDDRQKRVAAAVLEQVDAFITLRQKYEEAAVAATTKGSKLEELNKVAKDSKIKIGDLAGAVEEVGDGMVKAASKLSENFTKAIEDLGEKVPELAGQLRLLKATADGLGDVRLNGFLPSPQNALARAGRFTEVDAAKGFFDKITTLLKGSEGFQPTAKFDVTKFRAGYGSDTVTLSDGSVRAIEKGMQVSVEDANRDLSRRVAEFAAVVQKRVGADTFNRLTSNQQASLTSLQYNGGLTDSMVKAVKAGNTETVAALIRASAVFTGRDGKRHDLTDRRNTEADLFTSGRSEFNEASGKAVLESQEEARKKEQEASEKRIKDQKDFNELLTKQGAESAFNVQQLQLEERQRSINKAVHEAELAAQKAGTKLTADQRANIERNAAAEYDAANKSKLASKEREQIEKNVNALIEQRKILLDLIEGATKSGDADQVTALQAKLEVVNDKLFDATEAARAFWATQKGPDSELALLKLDQTSQGLDEVKEKMFDGAQINQDFASGAVSAFRSIGESIGQVISQGGSLKDIFKAAKNAFLKFASDFLLKIAEMILQQAILNALGGGGGNKGGGFGGFISGIAAGFFHDGSNGPAGKSKSMTIANPAWFNNATTRLHSGKMGNLGPSEMAAVIEKDETVLTPEQMSGLVSGKGGANITVINSSDPADALAKALAVPRGQKVLMNHIEDNKNAFKGVLS